MPGAPIPRPCRVAVIGLGFGRAVHVPVFRTLPGVEVAAVVASRLDKAQDAAAEHGIPVAADRVDALFGLGLDAVSIALPPAAGWDAAMRCAEQRLAILSEKPLAGTLAQARALNAAATGLTTAVNFGFAELKGFRLLRTLVRRRRFGAVRGVHVSWLTESYAHRHGGWSWKLDGARHGGVMTSHAAHLFHLMHWIFGPVTMEHARFDDRVTAAIAPAGQRAAEDTACLIMALADGGSATAVLSNASPGADQHRWEVVCDGGTLRLAKRSSGVMAGFDLTLERGRGMELLYAEPDGGDAEGRLAPFRRLARRFVAGVREGRPCTPDFTAGLRVQGLIDDARRLAGAPDTDEG